MAIKQVVLVAGFDYELTSAGFAWRAENRMARLIKKHPKDRLVFTLFDVGAGKVSKSEIKDPKKKDSMRNRTWTKIKSFTPVGPANYTTRIVGRENHFDAATGAGIMSITDVYAYVQAIGAGPNAGSLLELSFFCHGWMGGPILVNSFDPNASDASTPRDPNDKDARIVKDFIPPTTSATELADFTKAFSSSGIVWTWGCAFARAYNIILWTVFRTPVYKTRPHGKIKDTDILKLEFTEDLTKSDGADRFNEIKDGILPGGTLKTGPPRSYRISLSFSDLKSAFQTALNSSYSSAIAKKTLVNTYGALPGTYATYEEIPRKKLPLMLIPQKAPPYSSNFSRTIDFYKTYLKVTIDPEKRGYGLFKRP